MPSPQVLFDIKKHRGIKYVKAIKDGSITCLQCLNFVNVQIRWVNITTDIMSCSYLAI